MSSYYIYLISSLPSIGVGMKAPLSFSEFLKACEGLIPEDDINAIRSIEAMKLNCHAAKNETLKKWMIFETMLRNELVKIRALKKKIDPAKYLRMDGCPGSHDISHIAINACRRPSMLEAEKALDLARWENLEELAMGHYFDLDILVVYACKLRILEKWDKIRSAEAGVMLEEVLSR